MDLENRGFFTKTVSSINSDSNRLSENRKRKNPKHLTISEIFFVVFKHAYF